MKSLEEEAFKNLIMEHYSFLKRPVFITNKDIFVGNETKNLDRLEKYFNKK